MRLIGKIMFFMVLAGCRGSSSSVENVKFDQFMAENSCLNIRYSVNSKIVSFGDTVDLKVEITNSCTKEELAYVGNAFIKRYDTTLRAFYFVDPYLDRHYKRLGSNSDYSKLYFTPLQSTVISYSVLIDSLFFQYGNNSIVIRCPLIQAMASKSGKNKWDYFDITQEARFDIKVE